MTRRSFLRNLFFLGAMLPIGRRDAFVTSIRDTCNTADPLSSQLANFFRDKESARAVGLEYLRMAPTEADVRQLTKLICSCWQEQFDELARADMRKIKNVLVNQQREDFEKGRVINLQGWILSETEARLCALTALV